MGHTKLGALPPSTNDVSCLTHVVQAGCSPLVGFRVRRVVAQRPRGFRHGLLVLRQLESTIKSGKHQRYAAAKDNDDEQGVNTRCRNLSAQG